MSTRKCIHRLLPLITLIYFSVNAQNAFTYLADYNKVAFYGFADSAGNTKTLGIYNLIMMPHEGICMVRAGMKSEDDFDNMRFGFNRPDGTEITAPVYADARDFSDGMAAVAFKSGFITRWGYINKSGKQVIAAIYPYVKSFAAGIAPVAVAENKWVYIDKTGKTVIPGPFYNADTLSEGLAVVSVDKDMGYGVIGHEMGYIDATGKMVIKPAYNYAHPFKDGIAVATIAEFAKDGSYKNYAILIDKTGKRLTTKEYVDISGSPSDGLYAAKVSGKSAINTETDTWTLIDKTGREVPGVSVMYAPYFSEGLALVQKDNKYGYMNKTGKMVIPAKFENALHFYEGLAPYREIKDGPYGYINKKGETVIAPKYITAGSFNEGLAVVGTGKDFYDSNKKYGVIDKTGKTVIPFEYSGIGEFKNGRAVASKNYISFYLYRNGKTSLVYDVSTLAETRYALIAMGKNDLESAFTILAKLENKNYPVAQYYEGIILLQSKPPRQDLAKGADLVRKAAAGGHPEAMYVNAVLYTRATPADYMAAVGWYQKAESAGIPAASRDLGTLQERGLGGLTADPAKAALYYQKASEAGDAQAMYQLAVLYRDGRGVEKNEMRYQALINDAAKKGYVPAKEAQSRIIRAK